MPGVCERNPVRCVNHFNIRLCSGWVKNNLSWVENGQTQRLGCFNPAVGLNVCPTCWAVLFNSAIVKK